MRRIRICLEAGCVLVTVLSITACSPQVTATLPGVVQVQTVGTAENNPRTVLIHTSETVEVVPDMAEIVYGVTTEHRDASACQQENAEKLDEILAYLKDKGYEDSSIKTTGFSLNPQYDWSGNSRKLVGYEMSTQITVTDVPMEDVGALLSQTVETGANEIQNVTYFSSTYDEAYEEALAKAVEMAQSKAETLAHAGGYQVVGIMSIVEQADSQYGRYVESGISRNSSLDAAAEKAMAVEMAVMPGEMQVTADISVEFELLPR